MRTISAWCGAVLLAGAACRADPGRAPSPGPASNEVLIFAASSLQTALDELEPAIRQATGVGVRVSYAASSALARQIESGAPADLFISADTHWMDYVEERGLVRRDTRVDLLGNALALVAPADDGPPALEIVPGFPLAETLGDGRLAIANPDSVPAGRYARAALTSLGVWDAVASRLAPAENVRAALLLVARGETALGVVYRTDALAEPAVRTVGVFPAASHPPIVYPAAQTTGASTDATRILAYLRSAAAEAVFDRLGFTRPSPLADRYSGLPRVLAWPNV